MNKNSSQKHIIAKKAAALIKDGDTIFVDPSSSCTFFVKELLNMKGITLITNNVEVLSLMSQSNINLICSGGLQTAPNRYHSNSIYKLTTTARYAIIITWKSAN